MKADIGKDYASLCCQQIPFTDYLFGDDQQKQLKDIGDVNKGGPKGVPQVMDIILAAGALFSKLVFKNSDLPTLKAQRALHDQTKQQASASEKVIVPKSVAGNLAKHMQSWR